ncbi:MAG: hypothetical protein JWM06_111, partial [Actinomycetia bacterium]|nr:hypothetical protein [Actinomycetes bacterium]
MFLEALKALLEADDRVDVVAVAHNGADAVEMAEAVRPDVALIDLAL